MHGTKMDTRKNLLDLNYQKYLQFYIGTIIIMFTYFIGIIIAFFTREIEIKNWFELSIISSLSIIFMAVSIKLLIIFSKRLNQITQEIKSLDK